MTWICPNPACGAANVMAYRVCDNCGAERERRPAAPERQLPPAYVEFQERRLVRSQPSDRCPEPGCDKTVAEHIAEFKRHSRMIEARVESHRL
jgi:hypothetical protein